MSDNDDNETQGVVFGVLAGVIFGIIALVAGLGMWTASQPAAPAAQVAAAEPSQQVVFTPAIHRSDWAVIPKTAGPVSI